MGVPLTERLAQQLSTGRMLVTEESITEYVEDVVKPELVEAKMRGVDLTLNDISGKDEWWFDVNKALCTKVVAAQGEETRQEVPSERSAHVTVFSGAVGCDTTPEYRNEYRRWQAARCAWEDDGWSVDAFDVQYPAPQKPLLFPLVDRVYAWMQTVTSKCDLGEEDFNLLDQVNLDSWDCAHFFLWPVLVLFARKGGANPCWARLAVSEKMLVGTTVDGWMNEEWKLKHYKLSRQSEFSPLNPKGKYKRTIVDQVDGHFSNLTVSLSEELEKDGSLALISPGHHTGALQIPDVRGGPNFHANRINRMLLRREMRMGHVVNEAVQVRMIEISVAISHNPRIWSKGQAR
eukprot:4789813-Prymnesium_polylepis.1